MKQHQASVLRGIANHDQHKALLRDAVNQWGEDEWQLFHAFVNLPPINPFDGLLKLCCLNAVRQVVLDEEEISDPVP